MDENFFPRARLLKGLSVSVCVVFGLLAAVPLLAAPAVKAGAQPATIGGGADSFASNLHYPKDVAASSADEATQFYCDVSERGDVETTFQVVAKDQPFKMAVQNALDWGRFNPATVDGKPVAAYVAGTVLFMHRDGKPVIVVSLATQDRDRIGKLENYIQPQIIGGLRRKLEEARTQLPYEVVAVGNAEVLVKVNERGGIDNTAITAEEPRSSGLGSLVETAVKSAQFTPALSEGKVAAGAINVVATFVDRTDGAEATE